MVMGMATCKDCLHVEVCEKHGTTVDFNVDDGVCLYFEKRFVLCKDCKHYKPQRTSAHWDNVTLYCCRVVVVKVGQDDFCSYGERKDNEV